MLFSKICAYNFYIRCHIAFFCGISVGYKNFSAVIQNALKGRLPYPCRINVSAFPCGICAVGIHIQQGYIRFRQSLRIQITKQTIMGCGRKRHRNGLSFQICYALNIVLFSNGKRFNISQNLMDPDDLNVNICRKSQRCGCGTLQTKVNTVGF